MRLDLSEIAAHLGKHIRYDINEAPIDDLGEDVRCVENVTGDVTFTNTGSNIVARGKFRTAVELTCSRCLTHYRMTVEGPIEEGLPLIYRGPETPPGATEEELPEDEKEPLFVDNIFDLEELLRQQIVIAVPIKPLCSEECKGLCPSCGAKLNEKPCDCPPSSDGSPFGALGQLLDEEKDK
jgi:uncharacterized protein